MHLSIFFFVAAIICLYLALNIVMSHFYTMNWRTQLIQRFNHPGVVLKVDAQLAKLFGAKGFIVGYDPRSVRFLFAYAKNEVHPTWFPIKALEPREGWLLSYFKKSLLKGKFVLLRIKGKI